MFEPPPASSWATPPEFYGDENVTTRRVRGFLANLGYVFHTPAEVFGTRAAAQGVNDETWLGKVAQTGWAVINRDTAILRRADELAAYRRASVHMFYLPGEARAAELVELLALNLTEICTETTMRAPRIWFVTRSGLNEIVDKRSGRAATRQPRNR